MSHRPLPLYALLTLLVVGLFCASLALGRAALPWSELGGEGAQAETLRLILIEIRLPRALLGLLLGAALGLSGAALQGFLRNPLADAGLIGISATASFGAVLALYTGLYASFALALPLGGLLGAGLGVLLIYLLAGHDSSMLTLILTGVAINSFAGALTALVLNFAPNPYAILEIVFWLLGSLADRSLDHFWLALPFVLAGTALLFSSARALDALSLGEDSAASLGFRLATVRWQVIGGTALAVGAAVAVSGAIGFVGLVVPHLLRPWVGQRPGALLAASALAGAALLLAADIAVRLLPTELELKLGVVTALIGGPFFLHLLWQTRRQLT
ncbi:MAG: FecCD family ABC transporter permease [Nevskiales bacterium]